MKKISAKKLREMLLESRVHNDHELFKVVNPTPPVISHVTSSKWESPRWRVWRVGRKVDPNAHWKDNGAKTFLISRVGDETPGQAKNRAFNAAVAWASEKYTRWSDEWVKTPFGSWAPNDALEVALSHHLLEIFGEIVYAPPTERPDTRPLAEAIKCAPIEPPAPTGDPVVKRITDKLYAENPEMAESAPTVETDGWYRVVVAGVAVFTQATSEQDAFQRIDHMVRHMATSVDVTPHITKRDPEVS